MADRKMADRKMADRKIKTDYGNSSFFWQPFFCPPFFCFQILIDLLLFRGWRSFESRLPGPPDKPGEALPPDQQKADDGAMQRKQRQDLIRAGIEKNDGGELMNMELNNQGHS